MPRSRCGAQVNGSHHVAASHHHCLLACSQSWKIAFPNIFLTQRQSLLVITSKKVCFVRGSRNVGMEKPEKFSKDTCNNQHLSYRKILLVMSINVQLPSTCVVFPRHGSLQLFLINTSWASLVGCEWEEASQDPGSITVG